MREPRFYRRFDYDRSRLPNPQLAVLENRVIGLEGARDRSGASIGYPGWNLIYYLALTHLRPDQRNTIVETGSNEGCSTIVLAQALVDSGCDGHVHSIEIEDEIIAKARRNIGQARLVPHVTLHHGDSHEKLKEIVAQEDSIRLAFLDGSHLYDHVLTEFELIAPKLEPDALVLFDNTYPIAEDGEDPRVNGALPEIARRHGGNLINLEFVSWFTPGFAMWQKTPQLEYRAYGDKA